MITVLPYRLGATLFVLSVVLLGACKSKDKKDDPASNPDSGRSANPIHSGRNEVTETSYILHGQRPTFAGGEDCDTGMQRFNSRAEMCLHVQDPVRNDGCARKERVEVFHEYCRDTGFEFEESLACTVTIYDKPFVDGDRDFDGVPIVASKEVCMGRSKSDPFRLVEDGRVETHLLPDVLLKAETRYVRKRSENRDNFSLLTLELVDPNFREGHDNYRLISPYLLTRSTGVGRYGRLRNHPENLTLVYRCGTTWACDNPDER